MTVPNPQHQHQHFNLVTEPWIDVRLDNGVQRLSLNDVMSQAHRIQDLAVTAPATRYSLWRFLIAITYGWYAYLPPGTQQSACAAAVDEGGPLDPGALLQIMNRLRPALWLYDPQRPFLQCTALLGLIKPGASKSPFHPLVSAFPHRPSNNNENWVGRPDVPLVGLPPAETALAVLSRHFATACGQEASVMPTDHEGKGFCNGGIYTRSVSNLSHFIVRRESLAASLVSNLVQFLAEQTGGLFFWEDQSPRPHDAWWLFTASGAATYVVFPGPPYLAQHMLKATQPASKTMRKTIMTERVRPADPHTLRMSSPVYLPANVSQYRHLATLYNKAKTVGDFCANVLDDAHLVYPSIRPRNLEIHSVDMGGTTNSARYDDVAVMQQRADFFMLRPEEAKAWKRVVGWLAKPKNSCASQLRYHVKQGIGFHAKSKTGQNLPVAAESAMWNAVEASLERILLRIRQGQAITALTTAEKSAWIEAAQLAYDSTTRPFLTSPEVVASVLWHRQELIRRVNAILR